MNEPLAERIRPKVLEDYISQQHLVGKDGVLTNLVKKGMIPSLLFWGPPGIGKTTLANIIATESKRPFYTLSAVSSGVKDVREVIEKAKKSGGLFTAKNPILFIDEIHRFSKSQQDSLLGAVEKGWVTLIGATTENPSFEVIPALLSRCQVYILNSFDKEDLVALLHRAIQKDAFLSSKKSP
jgi:putative ATPase